MRRFMGGRRRLIAAATVVTTALGAVLVVANPASAAGTLQGVYGTTFVDGAGDPRDDWGDHYSELGHSLCYGCADSTSDLVMMWQAVLFVEGNLPASGIDGNFGPKTRDATKAWQSAHQLTADGWVGNATWTRADDHLTWDEYGGYIMYQGTYGEIIIDRGAGAYGDGAYLLNYAERGGTTVFLNWPGAYWDSRVNFHKRTYTAGS